MLYSPQWDWDLPREEPLAWELVGPQVVYLERVFLGRVPWKELYSTAVIPQKGKAMTVKELRDKLSG